MSVSSTNFPNVSTRAWRLPQPGEVVAGKYRVTDVLGEGGLAVVLGAHHLRLDERVALKFLRPEFASDQDVVTRFLREGRAATKIKSEHVVRIHDVEATPEGAPFLVLEHLEGCDLETLLQRRGPIEIDTAVDYVLQACEAIACAHALGIVHRDLKPANLFLTHRTDGTPCIKVLDFGVSKMRQLEKLDPNRTSASAVMGTPHYMPPEQLRAATNADERSDIWAFGTILHELLAGAPPFAGDTAPELCANVMRDPPPPLMILRDNIPPALEAAVLKCLEKNPANRFPNIAAFAEAIAPFGSPTAFGSVQRIRKTLHGEMPPPLPSKNLITTPSKMSRIGVKRTHPALITLMAMLGFGVLGALVFVGTLHETEPRIFKQLLEKHMTASVGNVTLPASAAPEVAVTDLPRVPPPAPTASQAASPTPAPAPSPIASAAAPESAAAPAPSPAVPAAPAPAPSPAVAAVVAPAPVPAPAPAPPPSPAPAAQNARTNMQPLGAAAAHPATTHHTAARHTHRPAAAAPATAPVAPSDDDTTSPATKPAAPATAQPRDDDSLFDERK